MRGTQFQCVTDQALVQEAQEGNRHAFDELVRRFRAAVVLVAYEILHSRAAAEDVAQDVFVVVLHALPRLREPAKFAGWLHAITLNRARRAVGDALRTVPAEPAAIERLADQHLTSGVETPHRQWDLAEALEELSTDLRTVVLLRYSEQWSIARIAMFLALPVTTVNWRLHQARKTLKQILLQGEEDQHE